MTRKNSRRNMLRRGSAQLNRHAHLRLEHLEFRTQPSFLGTSTFSADMEAWSIGSGDFNGDGTPDLAVVNNFYAQTVSILLANGDGTFGPKTDYAAGTKPNAIAIADFDSDADLDFAVANETNLGSVAIFRGNGDGSFALGGEYGTNME